MTEQQLVAELAMADLAASELAAGDELGEVTYFTEVAEAFKSNKVESYLDLIALNVEKALELRNIAVKEKLLKGKRK